jgi:PP-loop superfamily ATP-utilizing enzyme
MEILYALQSGLFRDLEKFSVSFEKNGKDRCYPTKRMIFAILIGAGCRVCMDAYDSVSC